MEINSKKQKVNKFVTNNKINIDEWENFFREQYKGTTNHSELTFVVNEDILLSKKEIEKELRSLKNRLTRAR